MLRCVNSAAIEEARYGGQSLVPGWKGIEALDLFAHGVPHLVANPTSRGMLEDLAKRFAREIDASADAQRALNNLDRFVRAIGGRRFYFELLLDRPELVERISALFGASNFLSEILASHPTEIEPVFHDPIAKVDDLRKREGLYWEA